MPKRRYALLLAFPLAFAMLPLAGLFAFQGGPAPDGGSAATVTTLVTDSRDGAMARGSDPCDWPFEGGLTES